MRGAGGTHGVHAGGGGAQALGIAAPGRGGRVRKAPKTLMTGIKNEREKPGGPRERAVLRGYGALPSPGELEAAGADRVYLGHEFCERLLPGKEELIRDLELLAGAGLEATLSTPFLSEKGTERLAELLAGIDRIGAPRLEVVFNDWGALELLGEFPRFPRILGRLLSSQYAYCGEFPGVILELLGKARVGAVELNSPAHLRAVREQLGAAGIKTHLHAPFSCLTVSRFCSSVLRSGKYFRDAIAGCSSECLTAAGTAAYKNEGEGICAVRAAAAGNTLENGVLVRGNAWLLEMEKPAAGAGFGPDRLVSNRAYRDGLGGAQEPAGAGNA